MAQLQQILEMDPSKKHKKEDIIQLAIERLSIKKEPEQSALKYDHQFSVIPFGGLTVLQKIY